MQRNKLMRTFLKILVLLFFARVACVPPARSQFICHMAENIANGQGAANYWYTAASCQGTVAVVAAIAQSRSGIPGYYLAFFVSKDGGDSWTIETQGLADPTWSHQPTITTIDQIDLLNIIAAGDSGLLVRSTDGGTTWDILPSPTSHPIEGISFSDPRNGIFVVADTVHGTYVTTDGGSDWSPVSFTRGYAWGCHAYGNGTYRVFALGSGTLYTTRDDWNSVDSSRVIADTGLAHQYAFSGCSFGLGDTLIAYGVHHTTREPDPFISMTGDGGMAWKTMYDDSTSMWHSGSVNFMSNIRHDTIVASGNLINRVIWSSDRGKTWSSDTLIGKDSDFISAGNSGVAFSSRGRLIMSFNNGFASSLVVGDHETLSVGQNPASSDATLQIFPDPASSVLDLAGASPATAAELMDLLGREVLKSKLSASGELTLDVARLPRGMYMVMLEWHGRMIPVGRVILN